MSPEQVRAARSWLAWTQAELADRANVGLSTVKDYEGGKRTPIANNLEAMQTGSGEGGHEVHRQLDQRPNQQAIVDRAPAGYGPSGRDRFVMWYEFSWSELGGRPAPGSDPGAELNRYRFNARSFRTGITCLSPYARVKGFVSGREPPLEGQSRQLWPNSFSAASLPARSQWAGFHALRLFPGFSFAHEIPLLSGIVDRPWRSRNP